MNENNEEEFNPETLLDELSEGMSSCVASDILYHVNNKDAEKTERLLTEEGLSTKNAKRLAEYLIKKASRKKELVEISIQDIDKKNYKERYLISFGKQLETAFVHERESGRFYFIGSFDPIELEKVHQVWKINYKDN